ncbi:hypothetical protein ACG33_10750 [Steroidobacter denitrificans]|uniref:Acyl-CoA dehydrogenase n=1 Tax=Steroidobacter denitrificans TaxID=465721 RepID=A0A127FAX0_STEDE|nr:acyl-CoA dehydrogenase family protein [Steroidobacter denitrificans]AMN47567.1 hypothetical protein ACG33_10750 [Steroidobacter denitrificans]
MNFELSDDLVALRDVAREFLSERWTTEAARKALDGPAAVVPEALWAQMADMGWFGAACGEASGGSGLGMTAAALLAMEAGRALLPSALMSTLAGAIAIDRSGQGKLKGEVLPAIIAGTIPVTLAFEEQNGTWGPDGGALVADAAQGELSVSGTKILVPDAGTARLYLSSVSVAGRSMLLAVPAGLPGLTSAAMARIDGQDLGELCFDQVVVATDQMLGAYEDGSAVREAYAVWTVLVAADLLGCAEAAMDMTVEYCKQRMQFGRPIGAFQAVSHRLADVQVSIEIGRSLLYAACLSLDEQRSDACALVSAAKAFINEAAIESCEAAMQLHGGIGYTWELDVHLYLRRVRSNAVTAGDASYHREVVVRHLSDRYADQSDAGAEVT